MDWWAVPLVAFVAFTLYGIEGIAQTYEDPFGVHKIDINMDDIVEDARREVEVMLTAWQTQGPTNKGIFRPRVGENTAPSSPRSEYGGEFFSDIVESGEQASPGTTSGVKFVVSDANESSSFKDEERIRERPKRFSTSSNTDLTMQRGERSTNTHFET